MMSEKNMTVITLESESDSGPEDSAWRALPSSTGATATASAAASDSDAAILKTQHWSDALRMPPEAAAVVNAATAASAVSEFSPCSSSGGGGGAFSDEEEKMRLVGQIIELQSTLDDLSQRVEAVKEENLKLSSENRVLGQYIENLMAASSVFAAAASPKVKRKGGGGGGHAGRRGAKQTQ